MTHNEVALHLRQVAWDAQARRERRRAAVAVSLAIGAVFGLLWSVGLVLTMHSHHLTLR